MLNTRHWGSGDRVAILLHGRIADARAFWEIGPGLAARGYHAIGVDLPGHGRSPRDPHATLESAAEDLRRTIPNAPDLALGHSLGGMLLAVAASHVRWRPGRAVYVDSAVVRPAEDRMSVIAQLVEERRRRTPEWLRRERSSWRPGYIEAEVAANRAVDLPTAASLTVSASGRDLMPPREVRSLAIRAGDEPEPPRDDVTRLRAAGVAVRHIQDAGHSIWYSHLPEFMAALDDWI